MAAVRQMQRRRLVALIAAVLASLGLVVGVAVPASAHAVLEQTAPEQGSSVSTAPTQVLLTFDESVGISDRALEVLDSSGKRVDDGVPAHPKGNGSEVAVALKPGLPKGSYAVVWHVVSADSHPVAGTFSFGVGVVAGATPALPAGNETVGVLDGAARFLSFVGLVLLAGGCWFLVVLWPAGLKRKRPRRVLLTGWIAGAVSAVLLFFLEGPYGAGLGLGNVFSGPILSETFSTRYGKLMAVRLLILVLAIPVLRRMFSDDDQEAGNGHRIDLGGLGIVLLLTFSLSEHAGTGSHVPLAVTADVLHLAAVSVWLGGLVMLATSLLWKRAPGELAAVLPRWSRQAMIAVVVLVLAGTYGAWRNVGTWAGLVHTSYGKLLLAKWGTLVVVLLFANVGRVMVARWTRARLPEVRELAAVSGGGATTTIEREPSVVEAPVEPPPAQVRALRRSVVAETVLATGILLLTTWLVNDIPARTAYAPTFDSQVKGQDADGKTIQVTFDVTSTRTGPTTMHLYTYDAVGKVLAYTSATGDVEQPSTGLGPVRFTFSDSGPGHGTAENVVVPAQGRWDLTVQIVTPDGDDYAATTSYNVRP